MRILAAIDGSDCSDAVINEIILREWPKDSQVRLITAVEVPVPVASEGWAMDSEYLEQSDQMALRQAEIWLNNAMDKIECYPNSNIKISSDILRGSAKEVILSQADGWNADLILLGSHGYRGLKRLLLGSVSHAIASDANCSVEIVRAREDGSGPTGKVVTPVDDQC